HVGLHFEPGDESACSLQCHVEIVDAEEQEEAVARRRLVRAHQGGMLMGTPLVKAEQDGSIRVEKLTKVGMARGRRRLAEQRLVPLETPRHIAHPDDRPRAFHGVPPSRLTVNAEPRHSRWLQRLVRPAVLGNHYVRYRLLLLVKYPAPACGINIINRLRKGPNMTTEILSCVLSFAKWIGLRWADDSHSLRQRFLIVMINIFDSHQNGMCRVDLSGTRCPLGNYHGSSANQ